MELGAFSIGLAVKNIDVSRRFYEKFGFEFFVRDALPSTPAGTATLRSSPFSSYALMGLIGGAIISLISLVAATVHPGQNSGPFAALFGVGAIIWLSLFYGAIGFVGSLIMACLYNWVAGWVGGIWLDLQPPAAQDHAITRQAYADGGG